MVSPYSNGITPFKSSGVAYYYKTRYKSYVNYSTETTALKLFVPRRQCLRIAITSLFLPLASLPP